MKTILICQVIFLYFSCYDLFSQTADSISKKGKVVFMFSNGVGYAGKGPESKAGWGLAFRADLGYEYQGFIVMIGTGASAGGTVQYPEEWDWLNSDEDLIFSKHDQYFDIGLKLGYLIKVKNRVYINALTGVNMVHANRIYVTSHIGFLSDEVHEVHRKFSTPEIGIPLQLGINYNIVKKINVGLSVNANFNQIEDYYNILINLIFRNPT